MSFSSCIKIPASKNHVPTETGNQNIIDKELIPIDELISMGNKVFGHENWSHSVTSQTIDYVEYIMGKYFVGCATFVRVQRTDMNYHEALGYANTESTAKGSAIVSARNLSITCALRKALLCFGGAIEDRINKSLSLKAIKAKDSHLMVNEEKTDESAAKIHRNGQGSCAKENQDKNLVEANCQIKSTTKQQQPDSNRNKSPKPIEACDSPSSDVAVTITNGQRAPKSSNSCTNLLPKGRPMTDEEIRLERKRKQKQKQEEYKKLMMEKLAKSEDKVNPRY